MNNFSVRHSQRCGMIFFMKKLVRQHSGSPSPALTGPMSSPHISGSNHLWATQILASSEVLMLYLINQLANIPGVSANPGHS